MERILLPGGAEAVKSSVATRPGPDGDPAHIDIWAMSLGAAAEDDDVLSADERQRADRFVTPELRRRYVRGRTGLRQVLSLYLNLDPQTIVFQYGPHGKPSLPGGDDTEGAPRFNLSHSRERLLLAVARGVNVGVDLEWVSPGFPVTEVADRYLAPEDAGKLHGLPVERQLSEFFHLWTRKEAVLKGLGVGLSGSPADIRFTPDEGHWAVRLSGTLAASPGRWSVHDLQCWAGYAAALAVKHPS